MVYSGMFIRLPTRPTTWTTVSSVFHSSFTSGPRKADMALNNASGACSLK